MRVSVQNDACMPGLYALIFLHHLESVCFEQFTGSEKHCICLELSGSRSPQRVEGAVILNFLLTEKSKGIILNEYYLVKLLNGNPVNADSKIIEKHLEQLLFDIKRGFLQYVVLSLIDQGPKYAYEIKEKVYSVTGGTFDIDRNNLYKKLRTLEHEGILKSLEKPSEHGANRKYYSLTPFGKSFLKEVSALMQPVIESFYNRMQKPVGY